MSTEDKSAVPLHRPDGDLLLQKLDVDSPIGRAVINVSKKIRSQLLQNPDTETFVQSVAYTVLKELEAAANGRLRKVSFIVEDTRILPDGTMMRGSFTTKTAQIDGSPILNLQQKAGAFYENTQIEIPDKGQFIRTVCFLIEKSHAAALSQAKPTNGLGLGTSAGRQKHSTPGSTYKPLNGRW